MLLMLLNYILFMPLGLASNNVGSERPFDRKIDRLSNELQLNADQKAKLEAIFNEKHEKIHAIREESQNRIKEILNNEQFNIWESIKNKWGRGAIERSP